MAENRTDSLIAALVRCPRCRSALVADDVLRCSDATCLCAPAGFPSVDGAPALIDFDASIIDRDSLRGARGLEPSRRARTFLRRLREWASGPNREAARNCQIFLARLAAFPQPRVLIVGGGSRGSGTEALYAAPGVTVVGTDVYASPNIAILADGHQLPFADASFHAVWIQAVLEHVVSPETVVAEITRVLVDGGLVYAETPFLQAVHERAYDFTRYTRNGHRWLFRRFGEVASGTIGGPAESLLWSIRYFGRALFRSEKIGSAFVLAFFWLRYFDGLFGDDWRADAATGVYFLGTKQATQTIVPRDLIDYFPGVR